MNFQERERESARSVDTAIQLQPAAGCVAAAVAVVVVVLFLLPEVMEIDHPCP